MFKLVLILLAGLVCEAVGVVYLSRGLKEAGAPDPVTFANVLKFLPRAASNGHLWLGIALEAEGAKVFKKSDEGNCHRENSRLGRMSGNPVATAFPGRSAS